MTHTLSPARELGPSYFTYDPAVERRRDRDHAAGRIAFEQGHPEPKAFGRNGKSEDFRAGWWDARNGRY